MSKRKVYRKPPPSAPVEVNQYRVYQVHAVWPTGEREPHWGNYSMTAFRDRHTGKLIHESPRFIKYLEQRVGWGNGNKPTRSFKETMTFENPVVACEFVDALRKHARWDHAFRSRGTYGFEPPHASDIPAQKVPPMVRVVEITWAETRRLIGTAAEAVGGLSANHFGTLHA